MNKRYTKKSFDELIGDYEILKKAFELFVNWAEECDFGFDELGDLSNEYPIEVSDALASGELDYTEGLQYIALLEAKKSLKEINKETPMKPIRANCMYWCPECDANISFDNNYCHRCGQKIDWSDYE